MPFRRRLYDDQTLHAIDAKIASDTRNIITESLNLLQKGSPDTFLGRQTYEPFKAEKENNAGNGNAGHRAAL
jgi:hypothetical protein